MSNAETHRDPYALQSVQNALRILTLVHQNGEISVSEVSKSLTVGMSTAHRLLSTLKSEGFVRQSGTSKRYRLGASFARITGSAMNLDDYVAAAYQPMRTLVQAVEETVHLATLQGRNIRFLADAESPHLIRVTSRIGHTLPAHSTSSGKVLLAGMTDAEIHGLYPDSKLVRVTESTCVSLDALIEEIELVRLRGFATNMGESENDITSIAVPVHDPHGEVVAALTIASPRFRCSMREPLSATSETPQFFAPLRASADAVEALMSR